MHRLPAVATARPLTTVGQKIKNIGGHESPRILDLGPPRERPSHGGPLIGWSGAAKPTHLAPPSWVAMCRPALHGPAHPSKLWVDAPISKVRGQKSNNVCVTPRRSPPGRVGIDGIDRS